MHRSRTALGPAACMFALLVTTTACAADDKQKDPKLKEPTAAQLKTAKAIASGHAYQKHVVDEKLFPEVKNKNDFAELIGKVLANPTHHRDLEMNAKRTTTRSPTRS
jgi:hypothetical protein